MNDLNIFLKTYLLLLENVVKANNKHFRLFETTFLDFVSRCKNNINGVYILFREFEENEFIIVPIMPIMRTITADALTIAYLSTFLTDDLNEEQITINNEINSLHLEILSTRKEIFEIENPNEINSFESERDYYDFEKKKLKSKTDLHTTSVKSFIEGNFKLSNRNLSEKNKFERVNISNYKLKFDVKYCYLANKYFSQYYHYSPIGGVLSRTKNDEILEFDIQQIKIGLVSNSLILIDILLKLRLIEDYDVIELKNLADNLARDK